MLLEKVWGEVTENRISCNIYGIIFYVYAQKCNDAGVGVRFCAGQGKATGEKKSGGEGFRLERRPAIPAQAGPVSRRRAVISTR